MTSTGKICRYVMVGCPGAFNRVSPQQLRKALTGPLKDEMRGVLTELWLHSFWADYAGSSGVRICCLLRRGSLDPAFYILHEADSQQVLSEDFAPRMT